MLDVVKSRPDSPMFESEKRIMLVFGTRPELIKLAPVVAELRLRKIEHIIVNSGQHTDLIETTLRDLNIKPDHDLNVMTFGQTPNQVASKVIDGINRLIDEELPVAILVQGDTTTAFAAAFAAFNKKIMIGHVEAGLRSGDKFSPFPEEINRQLITNLADIHFAATENNRSILIGEGIAEKDVILTGNTVVDALIKLKEKGQASEDIRRLIDELKAKKVILMTLHRRESFGDTMTRYLKEIARFVSENSDIAAVFPVHPNPNVRAAAKEVLGNVERIKLIDPVKHSDFISLMSAAWMLVSDSGGVQEEAASLGRPLLILRENTERQEAVESGFAVLVGKESVYELLNHYHDDDSFIKFALSAKNPFGDGYAAQKIVDALCERLNIRVYQEQCAG